MKKRKIIAFVFIIVCTILFINSSINIIKWYKSNKENDEITYELKENIQNNENNDIFVNFNNLKQKNSDAVAYLKVNNTKIDYVVVKAADNEYYLKHNFNKKSSSSGWIFADYKNKFDGTDKNIVIYGHNMLNGSMFGTLKKTQKKEWFENEDNLNIMLITEEGINYYRVFSLYTIKKEDYYIKTEFKNMNEFKEFISIIKKRSINNFNIDVTSDDQILTLSTCSGNGKSRSVLHAKKLYN